MFDGILFDLDGTLWDAVPQICASWNRVLARRHPELPPLSAQRLRPCMGMLLPDIGRRLFPTLDRAEQAALTRACCTAENDYLATHCGALYPGVSVTLSLLAARCPLYIVSNCQEGYIEAFLTGAGLWERFAGFESAGHTGLPKDKNIALVVKRARLRAPVYIGDTAMDLEAARAAGVPFLHAGYGFGTVPEDVSAVHTFRAIPDALERMSPF